SRASTDCQRGSCGFMVGLPIQPADILIPRRTADTPVLAQQFSPRHPPVDRCTAGRSADAIYALLRYDDRLSPSARRLPMSYQVPARKRRPSSFREMVGQTHVLKALSNALDSQRLHHAYLFTGTRGVGKTTIARILAKC